MDLEQLRQILNLVREHELSEFEVEQEGLRLKIRKDAVGGHATGAPQMPAHAQAAAPGEARAPEMGAAVTVPSVAGPAPAHVARSCFERP